MINLVHERSKTMFNSRSGKSDKHQILFYFPIFEFQFKTLQVLFFFIKLSHSHIDATGRTEIRVSKMHIIGGRFDLN